MASAATARRMTALVRRWEASVESKAEFVRRHDVSLGTFEYWKRRVRRAAPMGDAVAFVPPGVSADHVRTIVVALRSAC